MRAHAAGTLLALLLALLGCAASTPCTEVLRDPDQLLEAANAAIAERDLALAYRYVALIHILHPESAQSRDAFPLAARLFRKNYMRHRTELDSIWVTSEPRFMISWLAGFVRDGETFPKEPMDALFVGSNYGLFREYLAYAQNHPRLSQWVVTAADDNGIVQEIQAVPAARPGS